MHIERRRRGRWLRDFWSLAKPYWTSEEKASAWAHLLAIVVGKSCFVYLNVVINTWYKDFWDAGAAADRGAFFHLIYEWIGIIIIWITVDAATWYLSMNICLRWRKWMTEDYLKRWLNGSQHYFSGLIDRNTDNPDQRISEDINYFVNETLDVFTGIYSNVITFCSFVFILWHLSGVLSFQLFHHNVEIRGYLVWACILYSGVSTWLTHRIGHRLVPLDVEQQRREADFRYGLVRVRENSESVAMLKGEQKEETALRERFSEIYRNYKAIMRKKVEVQYYKGAQGLAATMFPYFAAAPRLLSKAVQIGGFMQIANAFKQVDDALTYAVDKYPDLAHWRSVVQRLSGFNESIDRSRQIVVTRKLNKSSESSLLIEDLRVQLPSGAPLLHIESFKVRSGDSVLLVGPSGCGKSTLLRTIAGIWPFFSGSLSLPEGSSLFLPQKPYLPVGSLRGAILYSPLMPCVSEQEIKEVLKICRLSHLQKHLDDEENWSQILSGGEQQRIGFARALIQKPEWLFLDESTSAVDLVTETAFYEAIQNHLPEVTLISTGHRPSLAAFHKSKLDLMESVQEPMVVI